MDNCLEYLATITDYDLSELYGNIHADGINCILSSNQCKKECGKKLTTACLNCHTPADKNGSSDCPKAMAAIRCSRCLSSSTLSKCTHKALSNGTLAVIIGSSIVFIIVVGVLIRKYVTTRSNVTAEYEFEKSIPDSEVTRVLKNLDLDSSVFKN